MGVYPVQTRSGATCLELRDRFGNLLSTTVMSRDEYEIFIDYQAKIGEVAAFWDFKGLEAA